MQIIDKKISELKPYKKNPRKNDEAVKYVMESIRQFGFKVPVVIDVNDEIVCGHTRVNTAKKYSGTNGAQILAAELGF